MATMADVIRDFYQVAVGLWGLQPSEFWRMTPLEWWWLQDMKQRMQTDGMTRKEAVELRDYAEEIHAQDLAERER